MKKLKFTKMVGSGNDFIVITDRLSGNLAKLARTLCARRFGVGADGLLLLGKCKNADLSMRIFNADGTEAEMCGNGARCAAFFSGKSKVKLNTKAGMVSAEVSGSQVKIQLTAPSDIRLNLPLIVNDRLLKVNFINTGVPHVVVFVHRVEDINVQDIGRSIRYHAKLAPAGANVNFVAEKAKKLIQIRTYERGVEGETLACGTGSTAAALIFALKNNLDHLVRVKTQSKEILKVYFQKEGGVFKRVWLEGSARIVYKGECYV